MWENGTFDGADIQWRSPILGVVLLSACLITTAGNCLVVLAVCTKKYLRNPTGSVTYFVQGSFSR